MRWLQVNPNVYVDLDTVVKVEFTTNQPTPFGEQADLFAGERDKLIEVAKKGTSMPALQQLRALIGDGAGSTRWLRVRRDGVVGDNEDSYVNLEKVTLVTFTTAPDGDIARLKVLGGVEVGQVHLPAALRRVRQTVG